jgi:adenylate kinase
MRMVLLGAPGSGKGTQAVRLIEHYRVIHISTGDILRQAIRDGSDLGRKAQEFMTQGQLVPDQIMLDLIRERLSQADCDNGFILDGFPRTLPQAEGLKELLLRLLSPLDVVVSLEVPAEPIIIRLSARRVCQHCGKDFNLVSNPPPPDMVHPGCGGKIIQRDDDKPETIRQRLEVYHRQTEPLRDYYRKEGLLIEVDGLGTADQVFDRIIRLLNAD